MAQTERRWPRVLGLLVADVLAIHLAVAVAYSLRYLWAVGGAVGPYNFVAYREYAPWGQALAAILVVAYWLEGLYRRRNRRWLDTLYAIVTGTLVGMGLFVILLYGLRPPAPQSRLMLPYAAALIVALIGLVRAADAWYQRRRRLRGQGVRDVVVVGAGETGRAVMRTIMARPDAGLRVAGYLDDDPEKQAHALGRFEPLGATTDLARVLRDRPGTTVILALPWHCREHIIELVEVGEAAGVPVRIVPDMFQMSLNRIDMDSLHGIPLIAVREPAIRGWPYRIKRAMDVGISALGLLVLAPLLAIIAVAIRLDSPGPILFRQQRVGRDGRPFTCYKFRSMVDGAERMHEALRPHSETTGPIFKMRDDPRMTRAGRVIRRLSLDEVPQLWNVLVGDMSMVGPRPPMPSEVAEYADWHHRRLDIAPGLTGLWQVSGRSELTFDDMVMLDLFYAENWSLGLDVKILLRTVPTVLLGTGAY